ncbi:MAG: hypothetical protein MUF15_25050 [Acidobacteria bacterium]|jgi:hypothetical protein|nr:hypothetical protein [Acidobacteriota bacterium]
MNLMETRQKTIPTEILFKNQTLVMLYDIGGDSNKNKRKDLIEKFIALKPPDESGEGEWGVKINQEYSFIYFFDADKKGTQQRLKEIELEIKEIFKEDSLKISHACKTQVLKGYNVGCYIFAKEDGFGKLEDILIPLMQEGNEEIFQKAAEFLTLKDVNRLTRLELVKNTNGELEERYSSQKKHAFDEKKSQIGIAGQLQVSGKSNAVIIKDTDYIKFQKIRDNQLCRNILDFIHSL